MGIIKCKPWGQGQGDHVLVDEADFDPSFMHRLVEPEAPKAAKPSPKKKA